MQNISFYLKKFEQFGLKEKNLKKTVIDVVKDLLNIELEQENINIKNGNININVSGAVKTEIFINRTKIEREITVRIGSEKKVK